MTDGLSQIRKTGRSAELALGLAALCLWVSLSWTGVFTTAADVAGQAGTLAADLLLGFPICLAIWLATLVIRRSQTLARETARRERAEHDAFHAARRDTLTGLPNRLWFAETLAKALQRARDGRPTCALLFLDLDGFKPVNDTHGHAAGDWLLCQIAGRLREAAPDALQIARLGGDEFGVLLAPDSTQDVVAAAHRILREIDRPYSIDGVEVSLGASMGIVTCTDGDSSAEEVLQSADTAMYNAKRSGLVSNRVTLIVPRLKDALLNDDKRARERWSDDPAAALPPRDTRSSAAPRLQRAS